jgi:uncharacterized membrane protein (UPF0127 family)
MTRRLVAVALLLAAAPGGILRAADCAPGAVTLDTGSARVTYSVEIADEPDEGSRGLMFRTDLAPDGGMLFLFNEEAPRGFWMKNTPTPLDIIFLDRTGRVVSIAERTVPFSEKVLPSDGPAIAVLEVHAGESERHGFGPGTQALHPFFAEAPEPFRCPG